MQFDTESLVCENDLNSKLNELFYREHANAKLVEPWGLDIENAKQYVNKNWTRIVATSLGPYLRGDVLHHDLVKRSSSNGVLELSKDEYRHLQHVYKNRNGTSVKIILDFCVHQDMLKNEAVNLYPWMVEAPAIAEPSVADDSSASDPTVAPENTRAKKKRKK